METEAKSSKSKGSHRAEPFKLSHGCVALHDASCIMPYPSRRCEIKFDQKVLDFQIVELFRNG